MTKLQRVLNSIDFFYITTGAMISSGFLLIPGIIYFSPGPWILISYILATLLIIPGAFAKAEIATAIHQPEETFFFIQRNLGAGLGTFSGFASWLTMVFKSALSIKVIGLIITPYLKGINTTIISVVLVILFGLITSSGIKPFRKQQIILPLIFIGMLIIYLTFNYSYIDNQNFEPLLDIGNNTIIMMIPIIFISFSGITRIDTVYRKVKNPGKSIPKGIFASLTIVAILFFILLYIFIGRGLELSLSLIIPVTIGLLITGYSGLAEGRRYPMTMSKDNLIPSLFSKVSMRFKTPIYSILLTQITILLLTLPNVVYMLKGAATMKLLLLAFTSISLIILREGGIKSFKPKYRSPLYPGLIIAGFIIYISLILLIGLSSIILTLSIISFSLLWYLLYSKRRVSKDMAIISIAQRIFKLKRKNEDLSIELSEMLKERDDIEMDRFDRLIERASVIDLKEGTSREDLFNIIGEVFSKSLNESPKDIVNLLIAREKDSSTIIDRGLAIPHIVVYGSKKFDICILRSRDGIEYGGDERVKIFFAIGGSSDERNFHLQALMAIAQIVQNRTFKEQWNKAKDSMSLKKLIILSDRVRKGRI